MGGMKDAAFGDTPAVFYPRAPGYKEGTTSKLAASQVADVDNVRCLVLQKIREQPRTADEVAAALDIAIWTVRPRVSELRKLGKVEPDGKLRRKNESGSSAIVWREVTS